MKEMFDWPPDGRAGLGFFSFFAFGSFAGFLALSFLAAFFFLAINLNFLGAGQTQSPSDGTLATPEVSGHTNGAVITAGQSLARRSLSDLDRPIIPQRAQAG